MTRRKARRKAIFLVMEVCVIIILVGYLKQKIKYENIFCQGTIIDGEECSKLTVEEAKELLQKNYERYNLEIIFKDDETKNIEGTNINIKATNLDEKLNSIKDEQRKSISLKGKSYNVDKEYSYSKKKLKQQLSEMEELQETYMKNKTKIEYDYNESDKCFELSSQEIYYLDFDEVSVYVSNAIKEGKTSISLQDLYKIPDENQTLNELNSLISAEITYELPYGEKYKLDADTLHLWLYQEDKGTYENNEEVWNKNLEEFVENELKPLSETVGKTREFNATEKDTTVNVGGGDYGYELDEAAEIDQLKEEVKEQEKKTRKPIYSKVEVTDKNDGLGDSYVEIDLTRQKVWVYVDGELKVETNCVTGCINKGYDTPTGIYTLTYKQKDRILRGKKLSNGNYEYQSHVNYWMPFNGGVGLHDATWRSSFGGNIYISNGSHGCVNLPLEKAEKIYDIINDEMPIIVYKSE